jgi:hypothetical protein
MPMLMAEQLNEMTMIIGMITADESWICLCIGIMLSLAGTWLSHSISLSSTSVDSLEKYNKTKKWEDSSNICWVFLCPEVRKLYLLYVSLWSWSECAAANLY